MGSKRKGAGSEAARPRGCFDYFEFYFHGNISGSSKLLPDKIEKEGGAVVKVNRLRHAVLDAGCPQAHVQGEDDGLGNNGRGCVRVVVIYPEDGAAGLLDNPDYSESRRRAANAISKTLRLPAGLHAVGVLQKGYVLCSAPCSYSTPRPTCWSRFSAAMIGPPSPELKWQAQARTEKGAKLCGQDTAVSCARAMRGKQS